MSKLHESVLHGSAYEGRRVLPPDSEIPDSERSTTISEVVVHPAANVGGLSNIPRELLSGSEQIRDELDHSRLDVTLPGEEQARSGK